MPHARRRLEDNDAAGPVQAEGKVHVLEVGPEVFRIAADAEEQVTAVERPRPAGAEDGPAAPRGSARRSSAAAAQPAVTSGPSLSSSPTAPRAAVIPALAAAQKPRRRGSRIRRTPGNSPATPRAPPPGEPSSTTITSVS